MLGEGLGGLGEVSGDDGGDLAALEKAGYTDGGRRERGARLAAFRATASSGKAKNGERRRRGSDGDGRATTARLGSGRNSGNGGGKRERQRGKERSGRGEEAARSGGPDARQPRFGVAGIGRRDAVGLTPEKTGREKESDALCVREEKEGGDAGRCGRAAWAGWEKAAQVGGGEAARPGRREGVGRLRGAAQEGKEGRPGCAVTGRGGSRPGWRKKRKREGWPTGGKRERGRKEREKER